MVKHYQRNLADWWDKLKVFSHPLHFSQRLQDRQISTRTYKNTHTNKHINKHYCCSVLEQSVREWPAHLFWVSRSGTNPEILTNERVVDDMWDIMKVLSIVFTVEGKNGSTGQHSRNELSLYVYLSISHCLFDRYHSQTQKHTCLLQISSPTSGRGVRILLHRMSPVARW